MNRSFRRPTGATTASAWSTSQSQKLINTYPSGADPEAFALSHDGKVLYVSNEDTGMMSAVDLTSGQRARDGGCGLRAGRRGGEPGRPHRVRRPARPPTAYTWSMRSSMKVLAKIPTGKRPRAIYLAKQTHRGYATDEFGAALTVFSTDDYKVVKTIALGDPKVVRPMGIASTDGRRLYVTTGRFGALLEVDAEAGRILRTIDKVGQRPWGVALSRDGTKAYTANGPSGDISVVDLKSGRVDAGSQSEAVPGASWRPYRLNELQALRGGFGSSAGPCARAVGARNSGGVRRSA